MNNNQLGLLLYAEFWAIILLLSSTKGISFIIGAVISFIAITVIVCYFSLAYMTLGRDDSKRKPRK